MLPERIVPAEKIHAVLVHDNRIEIESPGCFPPQITPENIRETHGSFPNNKVIATVLFLTTLTF